MKSCCSPSCRGLTAQDIRNVVKRLVGISKPPEPGPGAVIPALARCPADGSAGSAATCVIGGQRQPPGVGVAVPAEAISDGRGPAPEGAQRVQIVAGHA